jgi:hypothetical protein
MTGQSHDYKRNGTTTLFAALDVSTGEVVGKHYRRRRRLEFLDFMNSVAVEWFRTGVEMARWEPSFSWVVTQGAGDSATFTSAGDPAFVSAYLADPDAYPASSSNGSGTLLPDGDGYVVEGRWGLLQWLPGCDLGWRRGAAFPSARSGRARRALRSRTGRACSDRGDLERYWNDRHG